VREGARACLHGRHPRKNIGTRAPILTLMHLPARAIGDIGPAGASPTFRAPGGWFSEETAMISGNFVDIPFTVHSKRRFCLVTVSDRARILIFGADPRGQLGRAC